MRGSGALRTATLKGWVTAAVRAVARRPPVSAPVGCGFGVTGLGLFTTELLGRDHRLEKALAERALGVLWQEVKRRPSTLRPHFVGHGRSTAGSRRWIRALTAFF